MQNPVKLQPSCATNWNFEYGVPPLQISPISECFISIKIKAHAEITAVCRLAFSFICILISHMKCL